MKKENIGIVTFPIGNAGYIPTSNLVDILSSISSEVFLITGNKGSDLAKGRTNIHVYNINHEKGPNAFVKIIRYINIQLRISYQLKRNTKNTRLWVFFIGGNLLIIPIIIAKLLRKKVILVHSGSFYEGFKSSKSLLALPINVLETINRMLSDHIILYSKNLIDEWNLKKYGNKISIATRHFINFSTFNIKKDIGERKNLVGYIGRLSEEKGISIFIKAIPIAMKKIKDIDFLIIGDGNFNNELNKFILTENISDRVKFIHWISHENVPDYLNDLKLLIIPSYTEGLPNILLEAMACGTPVLATPVGAIPEIIHDRETGFIISENNPDYIVENITNILNNPYLKNVVVAAKKFVEKKYTFSECVKSYQSIIQEVLK
jgi:glycosyltransferase involved in cell wall biosynthesis